MFCFCFFRAYFSLQILQFFGRSAKIFLPQGAGYPLYSYTNGVASGGTCPEAQVLGEHQHTFFRHSKRVLSRNFNQSMFKNAYFGEKTDSIECSAPELLFAFGGDSAPRPPRCYSYLLLQMYPVRFKLFFKFMK